MRFTLLRIGDWSGPRMWLGVGQSGPCASEDMVWCNFLARRMKHTSSPSPHTGALRRLRWCFRETVAGCRSLALDVLVMPNPFCRLCLDRCRASESLELAAGSAERERKIFGIPNECQVSRICGGQPSDIGRMLGCAGQIMCTGRKKFHLR